MAQYGTLITNIGLAQIANAQITQSKVGLEYIALGDGNGAHYVPTQNQKVLVNEVWRGPISELSIDPTNDNRIIVDGVIPVTAGGFTIREIGIFDDKNQLIAVGQYPEKYKPQLSEGVSEETIIHFVIETNNADVVKLTIDPTVIIASQKYVDGKIAAHTAPNKTDAHQIKNIEGLENELTSIKSAIGNGSTGNDILSRLDALETKVGNLNNLETTQKANLVAAINEVRQSAINAWQKGVENNTPIIDLGKRTAKRLFTFGSGDWTTDNVEVAWVRIPVANFSGIIKVTYTSYWNVRDASGGATVIYHIGRYGNQVVLNDMYIENISVNFASVYHLNAANPVDGAIDIGLVRAPEGKGFLEMLVEVQGIGLNPSKSAFDMLNEATRHFADTGSTTGYGYPWTPQRSNIPSLTEIANWNSVQHRFGHACSPVTDWNLANVNGMFMGSNVPNAPSNDWWMGTVIVHNDSYIVQKVIGVTDGREFERQKYNGVWESWIETSPRKLFQSVSEGKADNRAALAQKGVSVPVDPTFAQISQGILQIQTGKKTDRGTINIPALGAGATTSVSIVVYFKPGTVLINLDGRFLLNGVLQGNDWANRHSVYDIRVIPYDSTNWLVTFFIRGGQFGAGQQYNYATFIE